MRDASTRSATQGGGLGTTETDPLADAENLEIAHERIEQRCRLNRREVHLDIFSVELVECEQVVDERVQPLRVAVSRAHVVGGLPGDRARRVQHFLEVAENRREWRAELV